MSNARENVNFLTSTDWDIATLRLANWGAGAVPSQVMLKQNWIAGDGGGLFRYDASDTTTADNSGTVIVDAAGNRWKRQWTGSVLGAWFNIDPTGVADCTAAFQAMFAAAFAGSNFASIKLPRGKFRQESKITVTYPNPGVGLQDTDALAELTIEGEGDDTTEIFCPNNDWLQLDMSSLQHCVGLEKFSVTTGVAGTRIGLKAVVNYPFFGTFTGNSRVSITFRGSDGYGAVNHWAKAITGENINNWNFDDINIFGASTPAGIGVELDNPTGSGCLIINSTSRCAHNITFSGGHFSFLNKAVVAFRHVQTVSFIKTEFVQCNKALEVPYDAANSLQDFSLIDVTCYCLDDIIDIASQLPNLRIIGGLFAVYIGKKGIKLRKTDNFYIGGGAQFIPYAGANTPDAAIDIDDWVVGIGLISDVAVSSCGTAIRLGSTSENVTVSTGVVFTGNTSTITNTGTNNIVLFRTTSYTVANLPTALAGQLAFATNGRKAGEGAGAGTGVLVFHDGTAWKACDTGATVAA